MLRRRKTSKLITENQQTAKHPGDDWLKTLYSETVYLYIHEDNLAQPRGAIFVSIFAAVLTTLVVISPNAINSYCLEGTSLNLHVPVGGIILGLAWVFVVFILRQLIDHFEKTSLAAKAYVNMRGANLRILEDIIGAGFFGPAQFENI
jgi:hypothetical protein